MDATNKETTMENISSVFLSDEEVEEIYNRLSPQLIKQILTSWRNQAKYFSKMRKYYENEEYDRTRIAYCNAKYSSLFNCIMTIKEGKLNSFDEIYLRKI